MSDSQILFFTENCTFKLPDKTILRKWISNVISAKKSIQGPISFIFCDDEYLHKMNVEYLDHDTLTDIISFDYTENNTISGDLFISYQRVKENAKSLNIIALKELHRIMIHGVLHLLGHKDKTPTDKIAMTQAEDQALIILEQLLSEK